MKDLRSYGDFVIRILIRKRLQLYFWIGEGGEIGDSEFLGDGVTREDDLKITSNSSDWRPCLSWQSKSATDSMLFWNWASLLRCCSWKPTMRKCLSPSVNFPSKYFAFFPCFIGDTVATMPWILALSVAPASLTQSNSSLSFRFAIAQRF